MALQKKADVLVANLPYLPEADKSWLADEVMREPKTALFAGEGGLALFWRLEAQAFSLMTKGARLWFELDPRNVGKAFSGTEHWEKRQIFKDLVGRERFLRLLR